jgi:hypothetical protein
MAADKNQIVDPSVWVLISPRGMYYAGLHQDEESVWETALGWPDQSEISEKKRNGWYAAKATCTWQR